MEQEVIHGYKVHPAASFLPNLGKRDFRELAEDIKARGLEEPIVITPDGQLLDGRNRLRAWKEAGYAIKDIPTRTQDVEKDAGPAELYKTVYSLNMERRHLNKTQRISLRTKFLDAIGAMESDEDTARETDASPETVKKVKKLLKKGGAKAAKAVAGDTSGRGRPKGGGPPRVVVLNREELTPAKLAAYVIKKWNAVPRGFLDKFIEQLATQWKEFEGPGANGADEDTEETEAEGI